MIYPSKYTHIIWDWNGTLLNDAWLCVDVMNSILKEWDLPLKTLVEYRTLFDFPVKDYYVKLGFDFEKEPFEVVGMEFMVRYNNRQKESVLHQDADTVLKAFSDKGFHQSILSAREQNELLYETHYYQVNSYFDHIFGLDDHYAHGKTDVGIRLMSALGIPREKILFIGDTCHDAEVAAELGISCILIPNGHQSPARLIQSKVPMASSLYDLIRMI
jgi:phosphoglycolate phosphatase